MPARLGELAVRFGCELRGDPETVIDRVATLQDAGPGSLAFLANTKYRKHLRDDRCVGGRARCRECRDLCNECADRRKPVRDVMRAWPQFLNPEPAFAGGQHPTAVIEAGAQHRSDGLDRARAATSVPEARIGAGVFVGPGWVLLERVSIGAGTPARRAGHAVSRHDRRRALPAPCGRRDRRGRLRACARQGRVREGAAARRRVDRQRRGNRRQLDDRSRRDRGHGDRRRRQDRQPGADRAQHAHRATTRSSPDAPVSPGSAVIGKRCMIGGMAGVVGHIEICDDVFLAAQDDGHDERSRKPGYIPGSCRSTRRTGSGATARASGTSTNWQNACAGSSVPRARAATGGGQRRRGRRGRPDANEAHERGEEQ